MNFRVVFGNIGSDEALESRGFFFKATNIILSILCLVLFPKIFLSNEKRGVIIRNDVHVMVLKKVVE